jgi:sulfur relay (sulfurtransferase) complex TusBCD TusD component (DsrE family)
MSAKKLGIMISAAPQTPNFTHGLNLADAALKQGISVYLYCIDSAVSGLELLGELKERGLKLFACAYSMQERGLTNDAGATLAGLTILTDVIASTDRFVSFN